MQLDNIHGGVILSGLVFNMLATGPKVHRFKPSQGQWIFLRTMKIHSITSSGGVVKLSAPCHKILQAVKNIDMERFNLKKLNKGGRGMK
jgi:hypothetical protein